MTSLFVLGFIIDIVDVAVSRFRICNFLRLYCGFFPLRDVLGGGGGVHDTYCIADSKGVKLSIFNPTANDLERCHRGL